MTPDPTWSLSRESGRVVYRPDRKISVRWEAQLVDGACAMAAQHPITLAIGSVWSQLTVNEARDLHARLSAVLADERPGVWSGKLP